MKKGIKVIFVFFKWLLLTLLIIVIMPFVAVNCFTLIDGLEKYAINCGYESDEDKAKDRIYNLTGIEITQKVEMPYHLYEKITGIVPVPGRRFRYMVLKFENEPIELLNENSFIKGKNKDYENKFLFHLEDKPKSLEDIPQEYLPNFNEEYYYKYTDNGIHFVYNKQNCLLYVYIAPY